MPRIVLMKSRLLTIVYMLIALMRLTRCRLPTTMLISIAPMSIHTLADLNLWSLTKLLLVRAEKEQGASTGGQSLETGELPR